MFVCCMRRNMTHVYDKSAKKVFSSTLFLGSRVPPGLETVQLCTFLEAGLSENNTLHQLSLWSKEDQLKAVPCAANKTTLIK